MQNATDDLGTDPSIYKKKSPYTRKPLSKANVVGVRLDMYDSVAKDQRKYGDFCFRKEYTPIRALIEIVNFF